MRPFKIGDKVSYTRTSLPLNVQSGVGFVTEVTPDGRIRVCAQRVIPTFDSDDFVFRPGWLLSEVESTNARIWK